MTTPAALKNKPNILSILWKKNPFFFYFKKYFNRQINLNYLLKNNLNLKIITKVFVFVVIFFKSSKFKIYI